jgi:uncharacterized protein involved in exopolysaccharide biosynthesis
MILTLIVVVIALTVIVSVLQPPRYTATTSIVPPRERSGAGMGFGSGLLGGSEATLLRGMMDLTSVVDLYVGILESRVVAESIVDRFDLTQVYDVNDHRYLAERILRRRTTVDASAEEVVSITVEDKDPTRAAAIANAYVEELDRQNKRLSSGQASSKRIFLENRLKEIEAKLSKIDSIPSHEAQVQEMLYELLIRECELAKIEEAKSMPTIQVLDEAVPPETRKSRGTVLKVALAGVLAFALGVFLAIGREYLAQQALSQRGGSSAGSSSVLEECAGSEAGRPEQLPRGGAEAHTSPAPEVVGTHKNGRRRQI